jgi:hypothetical protein
MRLPSESVTLTPERIGELNSKLANMRHDINNQLSLMMAALELIHYKPETKDRMMAMLAEQPPRISTALGEFSSEFEQTLGITRT